MSVIGESTYRSIFDEKHQLQPTDVKLCLYNGDELPVLGMTDVSVTYENQSAMLPLLVVEGQGASLFGRNWLGQLQINWPRVHSLHIEKAPFDDLCQRHPTLFSDKIGTLQGTTAKIVVPSNARSHFFKPRRLPYSTKEKVEQELERLQSQGIITPVRFADWAAPIVPVLKTNGQVRICGDYRVTVNQAAQADVYPLPRVEDLVAAFSSGRIFSKLDLTPTSTFK